MSSASVYELTVSGLRRLTIAAETLNDISMALPQGVYTTFRTYSGSRVLHLDDHFRRLEESARMEGHQIRVDADRLRHAISDALEMTGFTIARVRITIGLTPSVAIYITLGELQEPAEQIYQDGVACAIADSALHRDMPKSKSTRFIQAGVTARKRADGANEVLLINEKNEILEGSSSNFFAVVDGTLHTAEEGVLAGTTRSIILDLAAPILPVMQTPITLAMLASVQEAFITSVTRAVLPVVSIGGRTVGAGVPGPYTRRIAKRFAETIDDELESIRQS